MNYDKSNIPLMRMGDIRKTLKRTFKVRTGKKIKLKARVRDDGNSTRIIYHTATVIKLYKSLLDLNDILYFWFATCFSADPVSTPASVSNSCKISAK